MERSCVLLLLLVLGDAADSSPIIFPGQLDHAEGDACRLSSGASGTCLRSCRPTPDLGELSRCGILDSSFLVCCPKAMKVGPVTLRDISPPFFTFECGRNSKAVLSRFGNSTGGVLRPEASAPPPSLPPVTLEVSELQPARSVTGVPHGQTPTPLTAITVSPLNFDIEAVIFGVDTELNAWPWMALIGEDDGGAEFRWFCGGVLINAQWVLTALHCFFHNTADVVRLGEYNYNDDFDMADHRDFGVAETVLYPDFTFGEAYHDLALLRLDKRVPKHPFISPVCLPWGTESDRNITGGTTTLTGWGDTQFGGFPSSILQEANVTVFPSAKCDLSYSDLPHYAASWPQGIGAETVCAGDPEGGRDACQGDSGGPIVSQGDGGQFVLAGIVSQGFGCGHKDYPGLYVNIRHHPYLEWIKRVAFTP